MRTRMLRIMMRLKNADGGDDASEMRMLMRKMVLPIGMMEMRMPTL